MKSLVLKIVYNNKIDIEQFKQLEVICTTVVYNEDLHNEKKKAWAIKGSCSARESPFAVLYLSDKIIKAFYAEITECTVDTIIAYIKKFVASGELEITNISKNLDSIQGFGNLTIGAECEIKCDNIIYTTDVVKSIDWINEIFETDTSIYKFKFIKNDTKTEDY